MLATLPSRPRTLFLIDGAGALLSLVLLLVLLLPYHEALGLSQATLQLFAIIAAALAAFSLTCSRLATSNHRPFMAILATANASYCLLTLSALYLHRQRVTPLGLLYFTGEVAIIAGLVFLEIASARRPRT